MVTSKQLLKVAGLKSARTLKRWADAGFIPQTQIGTHPDGHGKMGFWPDWVLERCRKIVELRRQGHSIPAAIRMIEEARK
jgi:MerR HTH family regulatory protein